MSIFRYRQWELYCILCLCWIWYCMLLLVVQACSSNIALSVELKALADMTKILTHCIWTMNMNKQKWISTDWGHMWLLITRVAHFHKWSLWKIKKKHDLIKNNSDSTCHIICWSRSTSRVSAIIVNIFRINCYFSICAKYWNNTKKVVILFK